MTHAIRVDYLVRCGECYFLAAPQGEDGCVKCGYDGGFLPSEAQNEGAEYVKLADVRKAIDAALPEVTA